MNVDGNKYLALKGILDQNSLNFEEKTEKYTKKRKNQTIEGINQTVPGIFKALSCLLSPCQGCSGPIQVKPYMDVIVSHFGIPEKILRETGVYFENPLGLEVQEVSVCGYLSKITNFTVNDKNGMPLIISAQYGYQVTNAFLAVSKVKNYKNFLFKQAKLALKKCVSQYPFMAQKQYESSLQRQSKKVEIHLKNSLSEFVKPIGIQINYFKFISIQFEKDMEKILLAQQQAEAYIRGRKAIAEGAIGIIEETIKSLEQKNIILNREETAALTSHLITIICNQGGTDLKITEYIQSPNNLIMTKN